MKLIYYHLQFWFWYIFWADEKGAKMYRENRNSLFGKDFYSKISRWGSRRDGETFVTKITHGKTFKNMV